jgi:hypothetical protein
MYGMTIINNKHWPFCAQRRNQSFLPEKIEPTRFLVSAYPVPGYLESLAGTRFPHTFPA